MPTETSNLSSPSAERALFAVQLEARKRAAGRSGYAYFMEQGLGKTGTTITEFLDELEAKRVDFLFVICPNSLKSTWEEEIKEWTSELTVKTWPEYDPRKSRDQPHVFLMNFEALIQSGFEAAMKFLQSGRVMLVLDESHKIKTHTAQTTKKTLLLTKYAVKRRILTGTPLGQNVMDLWPQLRFIGELDGVNPFAFRNHFAIMGGYMGKQVTGFKNEAELHKLLDSCSFRALKKDWLKDLPEKLPAVTRDVQMTAEQLMTYQEMKDDFYTMVQRHEISADQVINQMERLAQIGRGFLYDENGKAIELVKPELNPCYKELMAIREQVLGKVIIVTVHRYATEMLMGLMPNAAFIIKEDNMKKLGTTLEAQKARFNGDKNCREIILQISVGALGHTLLGGPGDDRCSTTIFYENSYNLIDRKQGEDRNHRIGQDKGVSYFDLAASPIDRKVIRALQRKEEIVKAIVDAVKAEHGAK